MRDFQRGGRSLAIGGEAMVATSHPRAAAAAYETLRRGGNAVDAGVAAALLLGFCEPQMTGLGGDCFALLQAEGGAPIGLNASGRAPAGLDLEQLRAAFADGPIPADSACAVTVPGAVIGLWTLLERHGRLGFEAVAAPAIDAAERGVVVAPRVAYDWAQSWRRLQGPGAGAFLGPDGGPLRLGDRFRAPGQAQVLRRIAAEGPSAFYEGPVAEDLVATLRALGGPHALDDFAAAATTDAAPIETRFEGRTVVELPPNGQGATALLALDILGGLDLAGLDPNGADRAHLEAEAVKLAYDARNRYLADPEAFPETEARLRAPGLADRLRALIDPRRAISNARLAPLAGGAHRDTVYIAVVDQDRLALSLIVSIFSSFGSGIASEAYGVLLHNRGSGFTLDPSHPNAAGPGKRPMHTLAPGLLRDPADGRAAGVFGVMGGQYQAAGHARLLSDLLVWGMDPQTALEQPRAFPEAAGLKLETGVSDAVIEALHARGHAPFRSDGPIGCGQAILIDRRRGALIGGADPRRDSVALGW